MLSSPAKYRLIRLFVKFRRRQITRIRGDVQQFIFAAQSKDQTVSGFPSVSHCAIRCICLQYYTVLPENLSLKSQDSAKRRKINGRNYLETQVHSCPIGLLSRTRATSAATVTLTIQHNLMMISGEGIVMSLEY